MHHQGDAVVVSYPFYFPTIDFFQADELSPEIGLLLAISRRVH
jgi:hypothetical protein